MFSSLYLPVINVTGAMGECMAPFNCRPARFVGVLVVVAVEVIERGARGRVAVVIVVAVVVV